MAVSKLFSTSLIRVRPEVQASQLMKRGSGKIMQLLNRITQDTAREAMYLLIPCDQQVSVLFCPSQRAQA